MFRPLVGELLTVFQKSKTLGVLELDKGSQNLILGPVQRWEVQGLTTAGRAGCILTEALKIIVALRGPLKGSGGGGDSGSGAS